MARQRGRNGGHHLPIPPCGGIDRSIGCRAGSGLETAPSRGVRRGLINEYQDGQDQKHPLLSHPSAAVPRATSARFLLYPPAAFLKLMLPLEESAGTTLRLPSDPSLAHQPRRDHAASIRGSSNQRRWERTACASSGEMLPRLSLAQQFLPVSFQRASST